ncbi:MAG: DegT/DnrJ/EryC1/StrS family aminotransferase [Lachnospiraceae bacterium]|nr:DegT/DnrJ/EryC1/StrS family aminotransferase [Lachnospiraceae bacterium]
MSEKIFVTQSTMPPFEEYVEEIRELWNTHLLTNMGPKHEKFRKALINYLGVENLDLFTNGHMALELTLQAMNLQGEVITTPFTFSSTTHAIVRNGLEPVFCDVDPTDFTIDVRKIEGLITDRTSAIVPVHVYGNVCNVEEINRIAEKNGLKVVYDAAHTFGCTYKGKGIGTFGNASCFSFHATKVFNSIEGGAVCHNDSELGYRVNQLKNFGIRDAETVLGIGTNAKMNEFCAAMGICNLRDIDNNIMLRGKIVQRYRKHLDKVPGLQLNPIQMNVKSNYAYFPVIFDEKIFGCSRNEVAAALAKEGIYARKYFYPLTNMLDCYKGRFDPEKTPVARYLSERVLTLPLYPTLSEADVDRVCRIIISCKK